MNHKVKFFVLFIYLLIIACYRDDNKVNSLLDQEIISWHDSLKTQPKQIFVFDKETGDRASGVYKKYRKNGTLLSEVPLRNGKQHGLVKNYYRNEKLFFEMTFKNGIADGLHKSYLKNGQLFCKGMYKKGFKTGEWEYYSKNGSLSSIEVYRKDSLINKKVFDNKQNS